jgi:hypothetical protein
MAAPNVAFCRPLILGSKGGDVRAHKRAISHAMPDAYPWREFTTFYGQWFEKAVKEFQRDHGIAPTGKIGKATHEKLERTRAKLKPDLWAFDRVAIDLAKDFCDEFTVSPEEKVRRAIVAAAYYWYQHRTQIAYSQFRPFQLGKPPWIPSRWDCSGHVTACHYAGGAPDPNGRGYDHQGYCHTPDTRLLTTDLRWVPAGDIQVGDELWAVDENLAPGREFAKGRAGRRFKRATVLSSFLSKKECVRVCLDTGESFVCSVDHPWLTQGRGHEWIRADHLIRRDARGDRVAHRPLVRLFLPWQAETSWEAGWLAGMFDGEGWIQKASRRDATLGRSTGIGATQVVGPTGDRLVAAAQKYGSFNVSVIEREGLQPRYDLSSNGGGTSAAAEFLGRIRAERLIENFRLDGAHVIGKHEARVVAVEPVGLREVQSIQTTARTYIAEGFAVHNTGTLMSTGHMVGNIDDLDPGDLIFYGHTTHGSAAFPPGSPTHVALYVGIVAGVPSVLSHGSYPMKLLPYNYRSINHLRAYDVA